MSAPTRSELDHRPTALAVRFANGDRVWYREGPSTRRPGVFDRYGSIRVAIVLVDEREGAVGRVYVSPLKICVRLDRDQERVERVEEPTA